MGHLFFDSKYYSTITTIEQTFLLLLVSALLVYLLYFIFSKILFRKTDANREILLGISFLWALTSFLLIFSSYCSLLFYFAGDDIHVFGWLFFAGILPQIIIYASIVFVYVLKRNSLRNRINNISLT